MEADAAACCEQAAAQQSATAARLTLNPAVAAAGPAPAQKCERLGSPNQGAVGSAPPAAARVAAGGAEAEPAPLLTGSELCPDVELSH